MVGRSLILRFYLHAVLSLVVLFGLVFGASHFLFEKHLDELFGRNYRTVATFVGHELERDMGPRGPEPARMKEIARVLHADMQFIPWERKGAYPSEMRRESLVFEPGRRGSPLGRRFWIRLDRADQPVGVVQTLWRPPHPAARPGLILAFAVITVMGLILLPPLYLGVLRPLRSMASLARRMGAGDLETPVPVTRADEFGDLERSFEDMRVQIRRMLNQRERLLGDISHELRGPLSRMAIALPLVASEQPGNPYLARIEHEMREMDRLIGEILSLARGRYVGAQEAIRLDLQDLVRELLGERELAMARRGLHLTTDLAPSPSRGDAKLLRRAIGNLLDNALKYAADQGQVRVATSTEGDQAILCVGNDGPGIQPGDLAAICEPFYRPDSSRQRDTGGVGLGLAIARTITETHGGRLTLRSDVGAWTEAELRLPLEKA